MPEYAWLIGAHAVGAVFCVTLLFYVTDPYDVADRKGCAAFVLVAILLLVAWPLVVAGYVISDLVALLRRK